MKDLLPDTNTLSFILKRQPLVLAHLDEAIRQGRNFLLASVVHYELSRYLDLKGAHRMRRLYDELVGDWRRCDLEFADWSAAASLWADRQIDLGPRPPALHLGAQARGHARDQ